MDQIQLQWNKNFIMLHRHRRSLLCINPLICNFILWIFIAQFSILNCSGIFYYIFTEQKWEEYFLYKNYCEKSKWKLFYNLIFNEKLTKLTESPSTFKSCIFKELKRNFEQKVAVALWDFSLVVTHLKMKYLFLNSFITLRSFKGCSIFHQHLSYAFLFIKFLRYIFVKAKE